MEPLQAAALFSTIVSLIRIFKQERGDRKKADRQAFTEWLDYHRHEDVKNFIANTAAVRTEVDSILAADHALMLQKLDGIQELVATLLSRVDEFRGLSQALVPDAQLSEQAISVLRQFVDTGDETLLYHSFGGGHANRLPEAFVRLVPPSDASNLPKPATIFTSSFAEIVGWVDSPLRTFKPKVFFH